MRTAIMALSLLSMTLGTAVFAQEGMGSGPPHNAKAPIIAPKHAPRAPAPSTARPHGR
jgi:hypothetical protein